MTQIRNHVVSMRMHHMLGTSRKAFMTSHSIANIHVTPGRSK